jgi:hypothetical protein
MVLKVLAWLSLASAILFGILAGVAIFLFRREPLAGFVNEAPKSMEAFTTSQSIGFWSAVVLLSLSLVLVVAILVTGYLTSSSDSDS